MDVRDSNPRDVESRNRCAGCDQEQHAKPAARGRSSGRQLQPPLRTTHALLRGGLSIAILGDVDSTHVACAWTFAGLRIAHSLVQATVNIIILRFTLFSLSWIALAVMIVRESILLFS
jgi:hypothetical protein